MYKLFGCAAVALLMGVAATGAAAQEPPLQELRISSQPALMSSIPFMLASEKGWWKDVGLKVTVTNFPAGAPQIAASSSWDVGLTGSVPAVLGAARFHLQTVAVSDDQSATNAILVSGKDADAIIKNPSLLKGKTLYLTANSTVDLAARACLKKYGFKQGEVDIQSMDPAQILSAMSAGSVTVAGLWAPNTYTAEEKLGAKVLCSAKDAGVFLPGVLVARAGWASQHPQMVAEFLAVYIRAQRFLAANRKEAVAYMRQDYTQGGVNISEAAMNQEFDIRPTFGLAAQLALFDRNGGESKIDAAMSGIATFMRQVGSLRPNEAVPDVKSYVTDRYLKLIEADPKLKAFAARTD